MRRAFVVVILCALLAPSASAFRPSARWILTRAVDAQLRRKVSTLRVTQDVVLYGLPTAPRGFATKQRTFVRAPFQVREELDLPDGEKVTIFTDKKTLVRRPDKSEKKKRSGANFFAHYVAAGGAASDQRVLGALLADLQRYGIDGGVVSYGRFHGTICYVIGGRTWENVSQLWIEKDSFTPVRVVVVGKADGKTVRLETEFQGWLSAQTEGYFPQVIEQYRDGVLTSRATTTTIERGKPLAGGLFATN